MDFERRTFLQGLLTLGLNQFSSMFRSGKNLATYQQALAANTPRKLALLIGINDYGAGHHSLQGCITDVERQRELLIHRYGFQDPDILTLRDRQATRANLQTAFQEHLVQQAQPGDIVIIHFSGYGSQSDQALTLLPSDALTGKDRQDLLRSNFLDWGRSLTTDKITYLFDTSHQQQPDYHGIWRPRSYPATPSLEPITDDLPETTTPPLTGTMLTAAAPGQLALEISEKDWCAGLFTYVLTRYLWEVATPSRINIVLQQVNGAMADQGITAQNREPLVGKNASLFLYGLLPEIHQGAEAFIQTANASASPQPTVQLALTGLPRAVLENASLYSCLQPEATTDTDPLLLQITDRAGLQAKALCLTSEAHLEPGQLLQEALRFIPSSIGLTLALDSSLERIERVDATSALEEIEVVTQVVSQEEPADCVLGKLATGAYGLFAAGGQQLWETQLTSGQAIKSVIGQLQSVLERQLALKLLQLLENEQSSRLNLKVSLEARQSPNNLPLLQKTTRRPRFPQTQRNPPSLSPGGDLPLTLSLGTQLQYRLENLGDRPLYCLILGQDSNGKSLAFLPEQEAVPFSPQQTLLIPPTDSAIAWQLSSGGILSEIQVIASQQPFTQTRQVLQSQLAAQGQSNGGLILEIDPLLTVVQTLIADLQSPVTAFPPALVRPPDFQILDLSTWATLIFRYRVTG